MAPELFVENYNEVVDMYAFGMNLLEMVTMECDSIVKTYKKVTCWVKPKASKKVRDGEVRELLRSVL
ncbi:serine/threonine-protein kinase WNK11-like isoform X1 [Tripterygium wilfordii]|uniref:non-specific serine/threonine protein kinase n=1 Tax=Tripterygium wilfordii TaxID=458696 RepID=A0A7J7C3V7_TRIWF|nr:serine/threonine-protein kinase WNK11-like isoform X1 [Tripterygium wilfordii]